MMARGVPGIPDLAHTLNDVTVITHCVSGELGNWSIVFCASFP